MKDELQDKMVEILDGISRSVAGAADFAVAQLPDIAYQYIVFGRAAFTLYLIIWLLISGTCLLVALRYGFFAKKVDSFGDWATERMAAARAGTMGFIFTSIGWMVVLHDFLLVWFAPKVWLLKELASLVK